MTLFTSLPYDIHDPCNQEYNSQSEKILYLRSRFALIVYAPILADFILCVHIIIANTSAAFNGIQVVL
jgi:hypothetical protein